MSLSIFVAMLWPTMGPSLSMTIFSGGMASGSTPRSPVPMSRTLKGRHCTRLTLYPPSSWKFTVNSVSTGFL